MSTLVNGRPRPSTITDDERNRLNDLYFELCGKVGIRDALTGQKTVLDAYEAALTAKRAADSEVRRATTELATLTAGLGWELKITRFKKVSNRTVLVTAGEDDVPMTGPEMKVWIEDEVAKDPEAISATAELRAVLDDQEAARDAVVMAEKRISAAKYELAACTQMLATLTTALPKGGTA